jgi:hypothetical protein
MPRTPRYKASANAQRRWDHWQDRPVSKRFLRPHDRKHGWTVVRLVPASREPFLDALHLLFAYGQLSQQLGGFPEAFEPAWAAWLAHTKALTAALASQGARVCDGP